jgi:hypothetical protein
MRSGWLHAVISLLDFDQSGFSQQTFQVYIRLHFLVDDTHSTTRVNPNGKTRFTWFFTAIGSQSAVTAKLNTFLKITRVLFQIIPFAFDWASHK